MSYWVYILRSLKNGRFYIGHTGNLEKRLARHNSGGNIYTRNIRPLELVHSEIYNSRGEAMEREKQIKSYKGGEEFRRLIKNLRRWQSGQLHQTVNLTPIGLRRFESCPPHKPIASRYKRDGYMPTGVRIPLPAQTSGVSLGWEVRRYITPQILCAPLSGAHLRLQLKGLGFLYLAHVHAEYCRRQFVDFPLSWCDGDVGRDYPSLFQFRNYIILFVGFHPSPIRRNTHLTIYRLGFVCGHLGLLLW